MRSWPRCATPASCICCAVVVRTVGRRPELHRGHRCRRGRFRCVRCLLARPGPGSRQGGAGLVGAHGSWWWGARLAAGGTVVTSTVERRGRRSAHVDAGRCAGARSMDPRGTAVTASAGGVRDHAGQCLRSHEWRNSGARRSTTESRPALLALSSALPPRGHPTTSGITTDGRRQALVSSDCSTTRRCNRWCPSTSSQLGPWWRPPATGMA
jgi:hypothetical protein